MLGKISRLIKQVPSKSLGTLYDLLKKLASKDGEAWLEALKQFLRQELEVVDKGLGGIFSTKKTNLIIALQEAEAFHKKAFGEEVHLSKMFALPKTLPWNELIAVFQPAGADNRACVKAMQAVMGGNAAYEEVDVNSYSNSSASGKPRLFLIERSERPTADTMGMSPDQLIATKREFIGLGAYALAMGQYFMATGKYLDEPTWTWFPNDRLPSGYVARGHWGPGSRQVGFRWSRPSHGSSNAGAREAISVPLKP